MDARGFIRMRRFARLHSKMLGVASLFGLLAVGFLFTWKSQAAEQQPVAFDHSIMVQGGIPCLFCHSAALKSPAAGMPSVEKCMGCHRFVAVESPQIELLAGYWERQEPIRWVRVNRLARFVYFSHQVHLATGLNCERCHGDVSRMTETRAVVKMDMGWCLHCHEQQPEARELTDCIVCHQ